MNLHLVSKCILAVLLAVCLIQAEGSRQKLKSKMLKLSAQRSSPRKNGIHPLTLVVTPLTPASKLFCTADESKIKDAFNKAFKPDSLSGAITVTPSAFTLAYTSLGDIMKGAAAFLSSISNLARAQVIYAFVEYNVCGDVTQVDLTTIHNIDLDVLLVTAITASSITPATKAGLIQQYVDVLGGIKEQLNTLLKAARDQKTPTLKSLTQRDKPNLKKIVTQIMDDVYDQFHSYLLTALNTFKSKAVTQRQVFLSAASALETIVRTALGNAERNKEYSSLKKKIDNAFSQLRDDISYMQNWIYKSISKLMAQLEINVEKSIIDQVYEDIKLLIATADCA